MKTKLFHPRVVSFVGAAALLFGAGATTSRVFAQGTAFTYQGRLNDGTNPANGTYDLSFAIYDAATAGTQQGGTVTNTGTVVSNGLFTVTLDFGDQFPGADRWLQIAARTNGAATFTTLSPRQALTPSPYAITAETVVSGGLEMGTYGNAITLNNPANEISGTFAGNGAGLTNVNASTLGGLGAAAFWQTTGNAGTTAGVNFLGTTDNKPLTLRANNEPALQLQYWSSGSFGISQDFGMNVIGGYWGNTTSNSATGATIAGGGFLNDFEEIVGGDFTSYPNVVTGNFGTIGGGYGNTAGVESTVPGGYGNSVTGTGSFAAGQDAQTTNDNTFIWGDGSQNPFTGANFENGFNVLASGGVFFFNGSEGVHVDYLNQNSGSIQYGLRFGAGASGEGIASERVAGANQYGLDFYTSSNNRMSIANNGLVGINTDTPSQQLEVNGNYVFIDGGNADDQNGPIDAYIGGNGSGSDVQVGSMNSAITTVGFWNPSAAAWMHIACSSISINGGSDVAEPFPVNANAGEIPAGAVMVIDANNPGRLKISDQPYDRRVAGVISGANGINPGIQMRQQGLLEGDRNVALTGRVYVQADTTNGAIEPGDLLTTSSTPGYAMKVTDHVRAQGAILGKAMTALSQGKGTVLVLVTLQ